MTYLPCIQTTASSVIRTAQNMLRQESIHRTRLQLQSLCIEQLQKAAFDPSACPVSVANIRRILESVNAKLSEHDAHAIRWYTGTDYSH